MKSYCFTPNVTIGISMQERVAVMLEPYFPKYLIYSVNNHGNDILISNDEKILLRGEVKSAIELFTNTWKNKKNDNITSGIRRGMFNIFLYELESEVKFFAFVTRFVDENLQWNGDIEVAFTLRKNVEDYIRDKMYKCGSYNLNIEKLPEVKATFHIEEFTELLKNKYKI